MKIVESMKVINEGPVFLAKHPQGDPMELAVIRSFHNQRSNGEHGPTIESIYSRPCGKGSKLEPFHPKLIRGSRHKAKLTREFRIDCVSFL